MSKVTIAIRDPELNIVATVEGWPLKDFPEFAVHRHHKFTDGWTVSHVETGCALLEWPLDYKRTASFAAESCLRSKGPAAVAKAVALAKRRIRRAVKAGK